MLLFLFRHFFFPPQGDRGSHQEEIDLSATLPVSSKPKLTYILWKTKYELGSENNNPFSIYPRCGPRKVLCENCIGVPQSTGAAEFRRSRRPRARLCTSSTWSRGPRKIRRLSEEAGRGVFSVPGNLGMAGFNLIIRNPGGILEERGLALTCLGHLTD